MENYFRTEAWLKACGKHPSQENLSVQIGCHIEEFVEFLSTLTIQHEEGAALLKEVITDLHALGNGLKKAGILAEIRDDRRVDALDALCDCEVTGNGIAYLAGMSKPEADIAVLWSNDDKLVKSSLN